MAKKRSGGRRRKFNLRKVRLSPAVAIGALDTLVVIVGAATAAVSDPLRIVSVDCSYTWSGKAAIDDGAVFGLAHSDYSATEIEECLEATNGIDLGNKIEQEKANRLVREIGVLTSGVAESAQFNDGERMKTKLNWLLSTGDTLSLWIRNSSGTIYTTGSTLVMSGVLWVKD